MEEVVICKKSLNEAPKGVLIVAGMLCIPCFIFSRVLLAERDKLLFSLFNITPEELSRAKSLFKLLGIDESQVEAILRQNEAWNLCNIWGSVFLAVSILCMVLCAVSLLLMMNHSEINVTNKRLYGKNSLGKSVDLPLDSISEVATSGFNTLIITAPSSKNRFLFLPDDYKAVSKEITQLVLESKEALKCSRF